MRIESINLYPNAHPLEDTYEVQKPPETKSAPQALIDSPLILDDSLLQKLRSDSSGSCLKVELTNVSFEDGRRAYLSRVLKGRISYHFSSTIEQFADRVPKGELIFLGDMTKKYHGARSEILGAKNFEDVTALSGDKTAPFDVGINRWVSYIDSDYKFLFGLDELAAGQSVEDRLSEINKEIERFAAENPDEYKAMIDEARGEALRKLDGEFEERLSGAVTNARIYYLRENNISFSSIEDADKEDARVDELVADFTEALREGHDSGLSTKDIFAKAFGAWHQRDADFTRFFLNAAKSIEQKRSEQGGNSSTGIWASGEGPIERLTVNPDGEPVHLTAPLYSVEEERRRNAEVFRPIQKIAELDWDILANKIEPDEDFLATAISFISRGF